MGHPRVVVIEAGRGDVTWDWDCEWNRDNWMIDQDQGCWTKTTNGGPWMMNEDRGRWSREMDQDQG